MKLQRDCMGEVVEVQTWGVFSGLVRQLTPTRLHDVQLYVSFSAHGRGIFFFFG